jgi:hypothetical protein
MPVQRLTNIDTGIEKIRLAYRKGHGSWRSIICDKRQIASANSIVGLSDFGIAVTSENAKHMVQYLHDAENMNYERLPESNSVSRLGWIQGRGFSPYVAGLAFDGDVSFRHFFDSVKECGSYEKQLNAMRAIRRGKIYARILLAASFASVLVEPCGSLPFFVHMWGGSGSGKTVGLMLAASVWANPEMGKYIHTFNSTAVGQELSAGFVNSLPLILDELQMDGKDRKDFDKMIYQLSEGVGRVRGAKAGGLQQTQTWANCIMTTGEQPISSASSGAGAINRVIEINCEDIKLFDDPVGTVETVKKNYGHVGKKFVELLDDPKIMEDAKNMQREFYKTLTSGELTEKQAISASLVLAADFVTTSYIFMDNAYLEPEDMEPFLSTKSEVSQNERAYKWLLDWVVRNGNKFQKINEHIERFGCEEDVPSGKNVCIIRSVFDEVCKDAGYNSVSFLTWLRSNGHIETHEKGFTKTKRVSGLPCNCVVLILNYDNENKLPF